MAGQRAAEVLELFLEREGLAELRELVGEVAQEPLDIDLAQERGHLAHHHGARAERLQHEAELGELRRAGDQPRGCGFLWVRPDRHADIHPLAISHGYGSGFHAEFDWTGTRDFSPWLVIDTALEFSAALGAERLRRYCHDLVTAAGEQIARSWREPLAGPAAMHASMMAIRLPSAWQRAVPATREAAAKLQSAFMREHRIAVAINVIDGALWARISAQVYNAPADYERLLALGLRGPR